MTESQSADVVLENLRQIRAKADAALRRAGRDPSSLRLMAVTKTVDPERINQVIAAGIDLLGENRVQEFLQKESSYDLKHAKVHFIGQLQSNKVKYMIDKVAMIESVSSLKLAQEIERQAGKRNLTMEILLEINIGGEASKAGFSPGELEEALVMISGMPHLKVMGLMCIPPKQDSEQYFCKIEELFVDIRRKNLHNISMGVLSMGMSGDYETAIAHGSTIVRLGTALFGARSR